MFRRKSQLQRIFNLYNRRYFGNKLRNVTVKWGKQPLQRGSGATLMGLTTTKIFADKTLKHLIQISDEYKKHANVAQMTLLHEMCHVKLNQDGEFKINHGPKFQTEMLRLAKVNAFRDLW